MSPSRSYHKQHNVLHSSNSSDLFPSRYRTFHGKETLNLSIEQIRSTKARKVNHQNSRVSLLFIR